jgi:hypothetical protein
MSSQRSCSGPASRNKIIEGVPTTLTSSRSRHPEINKFIEGVPEWSNGLGSGPSSLVLARVRTPSNPNSPSFFVLFLRGKVPNVSEVIFSVMSETNEGKAWNDSDYVFSLILRLVFEGEGPEC